MAWSMSDPASEMTYRVLRVLFSENKRDGDITSKIIISVVRFPQLSIFGCTNHLAARP